MYNRRMVVVYLKQCIGPSLYFVRAGSACDSCQRRILRICWFHHVTNAAEVTSQTGQEYLVSRIRRQRTAVFRHVC